MFRSIRFRLTVWYVVLLALTLAAFSGGVYFALRQNLYGNLQDTVDTRAQTLTGVLTFRGDLPVLTQSDAPTDPQGEQFARVFDKSGNVVYDNSTGVTVPIDQASVTRALSGSTVRDSVQSSDEVLQTVTQPIQHNAQVVGAIQVGVSEGDVR
ncbi:MAG: hypothetical protein ABI559_13570, partial [Chloroflexota bacterium]